MPYDHGVFQDLDAKLDALSSPTTDEVYETTIPYEPAMVAAAGVHRALNAGGGGSLPSEWAVGAEGSLHITQGEGTANAITLNITGSADALNNFFSVFENAGNLGMDFGVSGLHIWENTNGNLAFSVDASGVVIKMPLLPTADPHIAGQLWNSAGTLMVSAGP